MASKAKANQPAAGQPQDAAPCAADKTQSDSPDRCLNCPRDGPCRKYRQDNELLEYPHPVNPAKEEVEMMYEDRHGVTVEKDGTLWFCPHLNQPQLKRLPRPPVCRALDARDPRATGAAQTFDPKAKVPSQAPMEKVPFKLEYPKPAKHAGDVARHRLAFQHNPGVAVHEDGTLFYCSDKYGPCPAKPNREIFTGKKDEDDD